MIDTEPTLHEKPEVRVTPSALFTRTERAPSTNRLAGTAPSDATKVRPSSRLACAAFVALALACDDRDGRATPLDVESQPHTFDESALARLGLAPEASADVRTLLDARSYGSFAVGVAATPSEATRALRRLVRTEAPGPALQFIVDQGTIVGQLHGLTGLYLVDHAAFERAMPRFLEAPLSAARMSVGPNGCMLDADLTTIGEIVRAPDAIQLTGPADDWRSWPRGRGDFRMDIAGGGYPYRFFADSPEPGEAQAPTPEPSAVVEPSPETSG